MKANTYTSYQKGRRNALKAKGWISYALLCPPALIVELKLTAARWKAMHPEIYATAKGIAKKA